MTMKFALLGGAVLFVLSSLQARPNGRPGQALNPSERNVLITVVSGRPDMVSGGDALIHIDVPARIPANRVAVTLNDQMVAAAFHPDPTGHGLLGLVTGLRLGDNELKVFTNAGAHGSPAGHLTLKNFTITGPIFSGPHEKPFLCETQNFKLPDGTMLGAALDTDCSVKTVVTYIYKPTSDSAAHPAAAGRRPIEWVFRILPSLTQLPPDVARTTTTTGEKVPYVVRVETGTINRSIYQIAVLDDPTAGPVSPLAPPKGWNRRLIYTFGGGCPGGWYTQGATLGDARLGGGAVVNDDTVGSGYAEVGSSLNVAGNNCNGVLSAETVMMVKEQFIKTFGKPIFTFSRGGSGGSFQQNQIMDNYPGLLDGIIPSLSFPDVQANTQMSTDAQLLAVYYAKIGAVLTNDQKSAIGGVAELQNITNNAPQAGRINPLAYCPPALAVAARFDPFGNISGVRCDIYDHNISLYGRDPSTGFARRPIDNVGVQYGLAALNEGTITPGEFLDLNENIGGFDNNGRVVTTRSVADPIALHNAYQVGLVTYGGNGLSKVPIIDVRPYRDKQPAGDPHLKYNSFAYRERLKQANGTYDNEVMLSGPPGSADAPSPIDDYAQTKMDEWLTNLTKDTSSDPIMTKISRAKPADLVDSCWTPDGERIIEPQTPMSGRCGALYPAFPGPRAVAGGPTANNILKCQLKPLEAGDYSVKFTNTQWQRLSAIFPNGVCDWTKAGVEQQAPSGTWQSYVSAGETSSARAN